MPTHFPRAQAPPTGRSRGAARRLAARLSQLLSPHGQLRLGDGLTEPGPEPLGAGLGRAGEFPGGAAPPWLDTAGMRIAAGRWSQPPKVWLGVCGARGPRAGGWRELGEGALERRVPEAQAGESGWSGGVLRVWRADDEAGVEGAPAGCWLGPPWPDLGAACGISAASAGGGSIPGSGSPNQHQTAWAPSLGARHGGAAPSRGGARSPQGALLPGAGKVPRAGAPRADPPSRRLPLTAPAGPGRPRVLLPGERCARPLQRAAVRGLLGPPRQERASPPESRALTPAGGAPPSAWDGQNPCSPPWGGRAEGSPQGHPERPG